MAILDLTTENFIFPCYCVIDFIPSGVGCLIFGCSNCHFYHYCSDYLTYLGKQQSPAIDNSNLTYFLT